MMPWSWKDEMAFQAGIRADENSKTIKELEQRIEELEAASGLLEGDKP